MSEVKNKFNFMVESFPDSGRKKLTLYDEKHEKKQITKELNEDAAKRLAWMLITPPGIHSRFHKLVPFSEKN